MHSRTELYSNQVSTTVGRSEGELVIKDYRLHPRLRNVLLSYHMYESTRTCSLLIVWCTMSNGTRMYVPGIHNAPQPPRLC